MKINIKRFVAAVISSVMIFSSFTANLVSATDKNETISPADETITLAASKMTVTAGGWKESVFAEWLPVPGTSKYEVYVKKSSEGDDAYKQLDDELIRQYPTYWRADAVGLSAGEYDLKIVAKDGIGQELAWSIQQGIDVRAYNRAGFAWADSSTYKGAGAYNKDGTLKDDAVVIYVTSETAKTVTAGIKVDKDIVQRTGFQDIIQALEKGSETRPIVIRIIGMIKDTDMDRFDSGEEGLQIKGKAKYSNLNLTIEGIGNDAGINGFGMLLRNTGNVELRNFGVLNCMDDCISMDTGNCNLRVHNIDLFYGKAGGDSDQAKGDGSLDIKVGSTWVTFSENHLWDSGKTSLCGMTADCYSHYYVTYCNNWFDHSDSRHPRMRGGDVHIYNNYYDGNSKYGVGVTTGGSAFVENNYFRSVNNPMMVSLQGTDAMGAGTFSGEDGGYIKEYGNIMAGNFKFITGEDAYCAPTRDTKVPDTYIAKVVKSGVRYSNFDTDSSLMYDYTPLAANNVPTYVVSNAGRLNRGDLTWTFDNAVEDKNYGIIDGLKSSVVNYKSNLVSVGGTVKGTQTGGTPSSLTGIDGNVVEYQPVAKLEGLNLPNKTEQSKITAGNPNNLTSSATESLQYDLKIESSNFSKTSTTYSANTDVTGSPGTFTILAASDKTVSVNSSKGIQLGGAGSKDARAVKFTTTDKGILYLSGSSTSTDERFLEVVSEDGTVLSGTGVSTTLSKAPVSLPAAGTYYVYSKGKGINISFLGVVYGEPVVPDEPVYDDTPGFKYTSVEPGTPIAPSKPSEPKKVIDPDGEIVNPINPTTEATTESTTKDSENPTETTTKDSESPVETTTSQGTDIIRWGDVSGNNVLEVNDAALILNYVLSKTELLDTAENFKADLADVDGNNIIDAADASLVLEKCIKGSSFKFPNGRDWNDSEIPAETTSDEGNVDNPPTPPVGGAATYNFSDDAYAGLTAKVTSTVNGITFYAPDTIETNKPFDNVDGMSFKARALKITAANNTFVANKKEPSKNAIGLNLKSGNKIKVYVKPVSQTKLGEVAFTKASDYTTETKAFTADSTPKPYEFTAAENGTYYISINTNSALIYAIIVN